MLDIDVAMTARPLASYSDEWATLPQKIVDIPSTKKLSSAPDGMVRVSGGRYLFRVQGIEIEGSNDIGVDVQYPWEDSARRYHEQAMEIKSFFIDKYPVTNAQFKKFLDATKYHPADDLNFLRDWSEGTFREGWANKPVTWVSQQDARAYAVWAGKRLPDLLVDIGEADPFFERELKPELLEAACKAAGQPLTLRRHPGYDHSYYFISTFMADHLAWHAARLG